MSQWNGRNGSQKKNRYGKHRRVRWGRVALLAVFLIVIVISLSKLISYISDYYRHQAENAKLREIYFSAETEAPTLPPPTEAPAQEVENIPAATPTPQLQASPTPVVVEAQNPLATLAPKPYPANPSKTISERFRKLRRQNNDIIGWLTVGDLLSEAVVQRDNSYYLRRDYRGYHNDNGAIFLDESCDLNTRPYTLTLYGHNMKTGAMFGSLRNYENVTYYRNSPFITFDSMYENGRYVIFSVANVSLRVQDRNYCGFYRLDTCTYMERNSIIKDLCNLSVHTCLVDVNADDQLLLLVTCSGDDTERRVVAARRIRDGETEESLQKVIQNARKR